MCVDTTTAQPCLSSCSSAEMLNCFVLLCSCTCALASLKKEPVKTNVSARNEDRHDDTLAMYSVTM